MSDDLASVIDRLQQNRAAGAGLSPAQPPAATVFPRMLVAPIIAGDRVFDPVSGQSGIVTQATGFGAAALGTLTITLDDGSGVTRKPGDVIPRPTPPGL